MASITLAIQLNICRDPATEQIHVVLVGHKQGGGGCVCEYQPPDSDPQTWPVLDFEHEDYEALESHLCPNCFKDAA